MKTLRSTAFFVAASLLVAGSASAADRYWDSNGTSAGIGATTGSFGWDTSSAAWSTTSAGTDAAAYTFTNADKAVFGGATALSSVVTVTLAQPVTLNAIQFAKGTSSSYYSVTGGTITLDGTDPTIDTSLSLASGIGQIGATLVGTSGFKKTGNATLQISGDLTGLSGAIDVTSGTVSLTSSAILGTTATIRMANGTTLRSSTSGTRNIANDVTLNGDVTMGASSTGAVNISGKIDLNGAVRAVNFASTGTHTYSGVISNGGLTKSGAGALTLSALINPADG